MRTQVLALSLVALSTVSLTAACVVESTPQGAPEAAGVEGPGASSTSSASPGASARPTTDDAASSPDATAQPPLALGRVVEKSTPCRSRSRLRGATCAVLTVESCQDVPAIDVEVIVAEPTGGAPRGSIVFGSGGGGGAMYEDAGDQTVTLEMLERLRRAGFRVIERGWAGPPQTGQWFEGTAGVTKSACRYATLSSYLKSKHAPTPGGGAFCGTGNSGGAAELGYAMTRWNGDATFDYVLFTSGPAGQLDHSCGAVTPDWQTRCDSLLAGKTWTCGGGAKPVCALDPGIGQLLDSATRPATPCKDGARAALAADSAIAPSATRDFSHAKVEFFLASNDCNNGVVPAGLDYAAQVKNRGQAPSVTILPNVGHSMQANPAGAAAIEAALLESCK